MELKTQFEEWAQFSGGKFTRRQWLLAKWEVADGIVWPEEKITVMMRTITDALGLEPSHDLADLGCGGGWILQRLMPLAKTCVGLDFSRNMLENAFGIVPREKLVQGAIGQLPFKAEAFDRILCYFVLINMLDDKKVEHSIEDMFRIVKKGGRVVVGQLPDRAGSADYDRAKAEYFEFCCSRDGLGENFRDKNRMPQKLFDVPTLKAFLNRQGWRHEFRPSFNPFWRPGAPETVNWRFDLIVHKD
jgi:ubiquinone/menaquinone biosynthesis C-methylase UbiE